MHTRARALDFARCLRAIGCLGTVILSGWSLFWRANKRPPDVTRWTRRYAPRTGPTSCSSNGAMRPAACLGGYRSRWRATSSSMPMRERGLLPPAGDAVAACLAPVRAGMGQAIWNAAGDEPGICFGERGGTTGRADAGDRASHGCQLSTHLGGTRPRRPTVRRLSPTRAPALPRLPATPIV